MLEILTAVGTFGQFAVVLVAALFALRQLRQLQRQNELQASLPFLALSRSVEYRKATAAIAKVLANPSGPAYQWEDWLTEEFWPLRWIGNLFDEIGMLINAGLIDGDSVLLGYHFQIVAAWDALSPYIAQRRTVGRYPDVYTSFESLVVRARAITAQGRTASVRQALPPNLREEFDRSQRAVLELADQVRSSSAVG